MLAEQTEVVQHERMVAGGIPVRNLWLLMLYASDLYRFLGEQRSKFEDNPEKLADLIAEVLCHEVEVRLTRNLNVGYRRRSSDLSRVRGRIDHLRTEAHQLLKKGRVHCHFDELSLDTLRNRYVTSALSKLVGLVGGSKMRSRCSSLVSQLERLGVRNERPLRYSGRNDRFSRNDQADEKMAVAADLVFQMALPTQLAGRSLMRSPDSDVVWLRRLFERAVAGFYRVALASTKWSVMPGQRLYWQKEEESSGISALLPSMQTDIALEYPDDDYRLVVDTKFNRITTPGYHRDESLRSGYIYQMYAYLRSQERNDDLRSLSAEGMLLHPSIGKNVCESVMIQGHKLHFKTVDLAEDAASIRATLLDALPQLEPP
ncbi:5-methylcytosine-specific restriction endonuclease system specificity protein McrC [Marinobacter sp. R17]|uniref:5-methylcytosine-specific restriction endonuclease system specificity protein McrC n=1 Tax=Marinobacter sp. R17 TaxID=2484250 RepID=UPI000F4B4A93|nr:5-methylcytosine-specific restriction endonuclease system specificity protein McrC [Marinobacter sp. R17]ROU00077.1 5-methylcytosine-specific restriction endonuclease system specificity protein McrC [Marinobacter sp. R17]